MTLGILITIIAVSYAASDSRVTSDNAKFVRETVALQAIPWSPMVVMSRFLNMADVL